MARELSALGHVVTVITESGTEGDHYRLREGVRRIALDVEWPTARLREKVVAGFARLRALRLAIKESGADCVVAFGDTTNLRVLMSCAGIGVPIVVSERTDPRSHRIPGLWDWLRGWIYRRAATVVVQTEAVAQWARSLVPPDRVQVIPNAVCLPQLGAPRPTQLPAGPVVMAVGRFSEEKGFAMLIEAFARSGLGGGGWRLVILGEGPDRSALEEQVRGTGLQDRVLLPGLVPDPEIWLQHAEIFVLSSLYEGFPNALLEAMGCGVAAIAFDCPSGPGEIIQHGRSGLLVPAADVEALAKAVAALAEDPQRRRELGRSARAEVGVRFALPAIVKQWEALVRSVCANGRQ